MTPKRTYAVETLDEARQSTTKIMTGAQLAAPQELRLPPNASLLIRYHTVPGH